jgi:hypothetical protein
MEITAKREGITRTFSQTLWAKIPHTHRGRKDGWVALDEIKESMPKEAIEAEKAKEINYLTKDELLEIAQEKGIDIDGRSSKKTIIKAIENV